MPSLTRTSAVSSASVAWSSQPGGGLLVASNGAKARIAVARDSGSSAGGGGGSASRGAPAPARGRRRRGERLHDQHALALVALAARAR